MDALLSLLAWEEIVSKGSENVLLVNGLGGSTQILGSIHIEENAKKKNEISLLSVKFVFVHHVAPLEGLGSGTGNPIPVAPQGLV